VFYTDANGLEMMRREVDYYEVRAQSTTTQRASSNYYPINSAIMVEDELLGERLIVMNDRPAGGSQMSWETMKDSMNLK
jgi:hypothetical protein